MKRMHASSDRRPFKHDPAREVMLRWKQTGDARWQDLMPSMRELVEQYEAARASANGREQDTT